MNLFHSPYLSQLSALVAGCTDYNSYYHVIVDHDGEVLFELSSDSKRKNDLLPKYRFHFRNLLRGKSCVGGSASQNLRHLNQLYKNLMYCWENEMSGSINFDEITEVQSFNYRMMMNDIARESQWGYNPVFFKTSAGDFQRPAMK